MEKSSFFNSLNHDRRYSAADFAMFYGDLFTNGVFYEEPTSLLVVPDSGMKVSLLAGSAWINGYRYFNTGTLPLELAVADGNYTRIDRVVVQWNLIMRAVRCVVLQGVPSSAPVAPALTRTASIFEICLAEINVNAGIGAIVGADIVDTRLNPAVCGSSRTRSFLNYGEADTEALLAQMALINSKVSYLEHGAVTILTFRYYESSINPSLNSNVTMKNYYVVHDLFSQPRKMIVSGPRVTGILSQEISLKRLYFNYYPTVVKSPIYGIGSSGHYEVIGYEYALGMEPIVNGVEITVFIYN